MSQLKLVAQKKLEELSQLEPSNEAQQKELSQLQQHYGEITLRKAHAYTLLNLRGG